VVLRTVLGREMVEADDSASDVEGFDAVRQIGMMGRIEPVDGQPEPVELISSSPSHRSADIPTSGHSSRPTDGLGDLHHRFQLKAGDVVVAVETDAVSGNCLSEGIAISRFEGSGRQGQPGRCIV